MDKKEYSIEKVSKILTNNYKAKEITLYEISNSLKYLDMDKDCICKVYKIEDKEIINSLLSEKEKEEILITKEHLKQIELDANDMDIDLSTLKRDISIGELILVILESKDNINLSGFIIEGNGEKLYKLLEGFINNDVERVFNPLDETIEELSHYRPYGKYFK